MKNSAVYIQIIVSAAILLALYFVIDVKQLLNTPFTVTISDAIEILFVLVVSLFARSIRWQLLINYNQANKVSGNTSFKLLMVGLALNLVTPAKGGEVVKSYFGYKWTGIKERMVSVSLLDKAIAIAAVGILGIYSLAKTGSLVFAAAIAFSFAPLLFFMTFKWIMKIPPAKKVIEFVAARIKRLDILSMMGQFNYPLDLMFISFLLSIIGWLTTFYLMFLCFKVVNLPISFESVLIQSPLITLGRLFPFTLNGIGSDELIAVYLFSSEHVSETLIVAGALVYRIVVTVLPAVVGVYYLFTTRELENYRSINQ
ncbi:MAG: flippase-like domain-containing protein [Chitinophagales bacterium]|nr:flippase-like domain-containing protein [Chitinophagales bacterium]